MVATKVVALVVQGSEYPRGGGAYSDPWATNATTFAAKGGGRHTRNSSVQVLGWISII